MTSLVPSTWCQTLVAHGSSSSLEDRSPLKCLNGYYCEVEDGFSAVFMRDRDSNVFTYVSTVAYEPDFKRMALITVKGKCSSL